MTTNTKIRTEDVQECYDYVILTTSSHPRLAVPTAASYDFVLSQIAARTPTLDQKDALDGTLLTPSSSNPYVTLDELTDSLKGHIPWKTIGPVGSGSDWEGSDENVFITALATAASNHWFIVREGIYTFASSGVSVPEGTRLVAAGPSLTTITSTLSSPLITLGSNVLMGYFNVISTVASDGVCVSVVGDNVELYNNTFETSSSLGLTTHGSGINSLRIFDCGFKTGSVLISAGSAITVSECAFNTPSVYGLDLQGCQNASVIGNIFKSGFFAGRSDSTYLRMVGNHFNDGILTSSSAISTHLYRANTPSGMNNDAYDFNNLREYIGSPDLSETEPPYSNNYGGPAGQDLTARASALDLLVQWRYEERNWILTGQSNNTMVTWDPAANGLSTTSPLLLTSAHRTSYWEIPRIGYYIDNTTSWATGSSQFATTGSPYIYAQSFNPTANGTLFTASLKLAQIGDLSGQLTATIRTAGSSSPHTPGGNGTTIATSDPVSATLVSSGSSTWIDFTFSSGPVLSSGSWYSLCLLQSSSSGTVLVDIDPTDGYGTPAFHRVHPTLGGWTQETYGLLFKVRTLLLSPLTLSTNTALYYEVDRTLSTSPITLTPILGPLGSILNDSTHRQVYVLAFNLAGTLWWRGGGGTRFPATGGTPGTYFVDGSSVDLLTYIGATDYNDSDPLYSSNFAGLQGDPLSVRVGDTDTLIKRLFEYSNLTVSLTPSARIETYGSYINLTGTLYFDVPNTAQKAYVTSQSWALGPNEILYFTWDQNLLDTSGSDQAATWNIDTLGSLPLPDDYPQETKRFLFSWRPAMGSSFYLWNGTEMPMGGGVFPIQDYSGIKVVALSLPTSLPDNVVWDGSYLKWQGLSLLTPGTSSSANVLVDQATSSPGFNDLGNGTGLLITFSWVDRPTSNVTITKVTLPVTLQQNQLLWAQNQGGTLILF